MDVRNPIHKRAQTSSHPGLGTLVGTMMVPVGAMIALPLAPLPAAAQATITIPMVERMVEDRWIEAHRVPSLVPWATHRWRVDLPDGPVLREGGLVGDTLVVHRYGPTGPVLSLVVSATGGTVAAALAIPEGWPAHRSLGQDLDEQRARMLAQRAPDRSLPPEAMGWDLVVRPPEPGVTSWTDTVRTTSEFAGFRVDWRAERSFRVVGDTLLDDRSFPLVEERSRVEVEEVTPLNPWLAEDGTVIRKGSGELAGRIAIDPDGGVIRSRRDSLNLEGELTLALADGREWTVPARYEAVRTDRLHEVEAWNRAQEELRETRQDGASGMLIFPDEEEARAREGDPALLREARELWMRSTDREERRRADRIFRWAPDELVPSSRELLAGELAVGDTAAALDRIVAWARSTRGERVTEADLALLLPFVADPGRARAVGTYADRLLVDMVQGPAFRAAAPLMQSTSTDMTGPFPPHPDSPFTPEAWEMLQSLDQYARDPGLEALALAARAFTDPRGGGDELEGVLASRPLRSGTRVNSDHRVLSYVTEMHRGIGFWAGASARVPLPSEDAEWRAWSRWMVGTSEEYREWRAGTSLPQADRPPPVVRFDTSHRLTLRYHQARAGRDFQAEWARTMAKGVPADSATLVMGTLMQGLDPEPPAVEEVVRMLRDPSPAVTALGRRHLGPLFAGDAGAVAEPTDPAGEPDLSAGDLDLLMTLLNHLVPPDGDEPDDRPPHPWPSALGENGFMGGTRLAEGSSAPVHLQADGLPAALLQALPPGVTALPGEAWQALDPREGKILLRLTPPTRRGDLARLGFSWTVHEEREPHQSPSGYAGGTVFDLLVVDGGWEIVNLLGWIT